MIKNDIFTKYDDNLIISIYFLFLPHGHCHYDAEILIAVKIKRKNNE